MLKNVAIGIGILIGIVILYKIMKWLALIGIAGLALYFLWKKAG